MKKLILLILLISITSIASAEETPKEQPNRIVIYYFHKNVRCSMCYRMEDFFKGALAQHFKAQVDAGKIMFKLKNMEEKENKHFIKDYWLYDRAAVVSLVKNDKEVKYKILENIWIYLPNQDQFYAYVKEEVGKYVTELENE